jgi:hypothetical protein
MQRRAAAAYVVLFVLIAAGSYAFIATAQAPAVTIENPDHDLAAGDEFTVADRTYEVTEITLTEEEDDHGGSEETLTATLEWTNDSAISTESFERDGEVELDNTTYDVVIPNESDPGRATLREQPGDDVETVEREDGTYVVVQDGEGNEELVPIDEYEPLERVELSDGQQFDYDGNDAEVRIASDQLTFRWNEPTTNEVELTNDQTATLNGQRYLVFLEGEDRLLLTSDFESYEQQVQEIDRFDQRMNGFWGVTLLAGLTAILVAGLAYLPHKDT